MLDLQYNILGTENAGPENDGPNRKARKCRTEKYGTGKIMTD